MEKFSRWNDKGTGINPFAPSRGSLRSRKGVSAARYVAGVVLGIVRFPLLSIVGAIICLVDGLQLLLPMWPWRIVIRWILLCPLCRVALLLMGYWSIEERRPDARRLRLPKGKLSQKALQFGSDVRAGDVIVCNHTSFVEILYLTARFGADFCSSDIGSDGLVRRASVVETIMASMWPPSRKKAPVVASLRELAGQASLRSGAPLVVLPEGTGVRSNGSALLEFTKPAVCALDIAAKGKECSVRIHLFGFKYDCSASKFSPSYTVGHGVEYAARSCFYLSHSLSVRHLSHALRTGGKSPSRMTDEEKERVASVSGLRKLLASIVGARGVKCVALGVNEYVTFLDYWQEQANGSSRTKEE